MKTPGQIAYEEDCRRKPYYFDSPYLGRERRKTWDELDEIARGSWERDPTVMAAEPKP